MYHFCGNFPSFKHQISFRLNFCYPYIINSPLYFPSFLLYCLLLPIKTLVVTFVDFLLTNYIFKTRVLPRSICINAYLLFHQLKLFVLLKVKKSQFVFMRVRSPWVMDCSFFVVVTTTWFSFGTAQKFYVFHWYSYNMDWNDCDS